MTVRRIPITAGERRAIEAGHFCRFEVAPPVTVAHDAESFGVRTEPGGDYPEIEITSVLVGRVGKALCAYGNLCRHIPLELDLGEPAEEDEAFPDVRLAPVDDTKRHLVCFRHGALFELEHGRCVLGPCFGQRLHAFDIHDSGVELVLTARRWARR